MNRFLWSVDLAGSILLMCIASGYEEPVFLFVGWIFGLTSLWMLYKLRNE
jgi:hypothetical protein